MPLIEIANAVELWEQFERTAKLEDTFYDVALKEDICRQLTISPRRGDIKGYLHESSISVERLLAAILTSMQPFSQMLEELLSLFERIGARRSDSGLHIEFDFDEGKCLGLDLDEFRRDVAKVRRCTYHAELPADLWNFMQHLLGELRRQSFWPGMVVFDSFGRKEPYRDIIDWVCWSKDVRPNWRDSLALRWTSRHRRFPTCPRSGVFTLDTRLEMLWRFAEVAWDHYLDVLSLEDSQGRCDYKDSLYYAETDGWSEHMIRLVTELAHCIGDIDATHRHSSAEEAATAIDNALKRYGGGADVSITASLEQLESLLELPYWERRYELYSAWVLTQIDGALKGTGTRYSVREGVLSFSFKGVYLAECGLLSPSPLVYAELRSNLDNPIGRGRKHGIQPDYTIAVRPVLDPDSALAVVECKQYKRPNRKAFEAAMVDYANGRPQAFVSLVDYGKASRMSSVPAHVRSRTAMYGLMRPGTEAAGRFRDDLSAAIRAYYRNNAVRGKAWTVPWENPEASCSIRLSWNSSPRDLDLHVQVADVLNDGDEKAQVIDYHCLSHPDYAKFGRLDHDWRVGPGTETLQIEEWYPEGRYDVFVANYSGEEHVEGEVVVTVRCGKMEAVVRKHGKWELGMVWHAFRLSGFGLQVMDQMRWCMAR